MTNNKTTKRPKLKACPFCGSCAIVIHREQDAKSHAPFEYYHWAECVKCGAESATDEGYRFALDSWNNRPREAELETALHQAIVYMETDIPGNSFRLMCINHFKATLSRELSESQVKESEK